MGFQEEYFGCKDHIEKALRDSLSRPCPQAPLMDAMRYSLLAGGKRIRPVLLLKFCEACGGRAENALSAACGIEMLHTYSLIHDDLPCMDNDDLRRGKPTCHKVYGETNAVLAGDALQSAAFEMVLSSPVAPERVVAMGKTLAQAVGVMGMCGGQYLDTVNENITISIDELRNINALKTGALLRAACVMGAQCAGAAEEQLRAAAEYAENLGLAFQIRDDILDQISTEKELGKNIGSDEEEGKATYASLLGIDECTRLVGVYTERAKSAIRNVFADTCFLDALADTLSVRRK